MSTDGTAPSTVDVPHGRVRYRAFGSGEPIVFVHGYLVDGRIWDGVAERLAPDFSCIVPDWPMGSHRVAMDPDADLTPPGIVATIAGFLDALGLERVTVVGNDSGGAISQIFTATHPDRVERLVLTNCDTYEHFPPFPFTLMVSAARLPGAMTALSLPFRLGPLRRATYGLFAAERIDPELVDSWMEPSLADPAIKRDTQKFTVGLHKRYTLEAAERLGGFERPVLFPWGTADRFFKLSHAERLAGALPDTRIVEIPGAKTFVQLDRPDAVAEAIAEFVRSQPQSARASATGGQ
ncbi:MAG: alpha/beta fold hydrolase [Solirubrobacterales bacterium]